MADVGEAQGVVLQGLGHVPGLGGGAALWLFLACHLINYKIKWHICSKYLFNTKPYRFTEASTRNSLQELFVQDLEEEKAQPEAQR